MFATRLAGKASPGMAPTTAASTRSCSAPSPSPPERRSTQPYQLACYSSAVHGPCLSFRIYGRAQLYRAGELVAIRIPSVQEEAVRNLCRARADMVADRTLARHRLGKFLLRHGRAWRGGNAWTLTHQRWLLQQRFEEPALAATYAHYRAVLDARDAQPGGDRDRPSRLV
jgi:hypothetical protein